MLRDEVIGTINEILMKKIHFDITKLTDEQKNGSLLNPEYGFMAIDLFVLYMELEKKLGINFSQADVIEKRFDVYNNIVDSVMGKMKG